MPASAIAQHSDSVCAVCKNPILKGTRFTWGKSGRFHADGCGKQQEVKTEAKAETEAKAKVEQEPAKVEITSPGSIGAAIETAIATAVQSVASHAAVSAIEAELQSIRERLDRDKPLTIEIKRFDGSEVKITNAHSLMPRLIRRLQRRMNVYLFGMPGSGKSTAAKMAAEALGVQYGYISLNPQTPDSRLLGFMDLNPGSETPIYRATLFFRCYTEGGVFCIDELDNASASLLTTLNGMIENGHGAFPHGVFQRHPDFMLVATGNTNGRGGDVMFPERRAFDAAFAERFVFIEWNYDLALEERLTLARNPKAGEWLRWTRNVRDFCFKEKIRVFFSPRTSMAGATILADGDSAEMAADEVGFRGVAPDIKKRILAAFPLPTASMAA